MTSLGVFLSFAWFRGWSGLCSLSFTDLWYPSLILENSWSSHLQVFLLPGFLSFPSQTLTTNSDHLILSQSSRAICPIFFTLQLYSSSQTPLATPSLIMSLLKTFFTYVTVIFIFSIYFLTVSISLLKYPTWPRKLPAFSTRDLNILNSYFRFHVW